MQNNDNKNPLEIPENQPAGDIKPEKGGVSKGKSQKIGKNKNKTMNRVKVVYAFAMLIALGTALFAKIATENALGNIGSIESDYFEISEKVTLGENTKDSPFLTTEEDYEVRQNLQDVPDTREETEKETQAESVSPATESESYAVPYESFYSLPMGTKILRDYSPSTPLYSATMGDWRTHSGVDFGASDGEQVKAIAKGRVTAVYDNILWGTVVEIDHGNGIIAKYCGFNAETVEVSAETRVESGTLLGYLGTVPCESNDLAHLHFEIYHNGKNVDPLEVMGRSD